MQNSAYSDRKIENTALAAVFFLLWTSYKFIENSELRKADGIVGLGGWS